jgi:hypothetical protein
MYIGDMPTCFTCKENKSTDSFAMRNKATGKRHSVCRLCQKEYRRNHYLANRKKYIEKAKTKHLSNVIRNKEHIAQHLRDNPCVDCGEKDIEVLQFDHIKPLNGPGGRIGNFISYSLKRLQEEMKKCDVRCANCHVRRSRRMQGWKYGALSKNGDPSE